MDRVVLFQEFCGYPVVRAQVMAYSRKWIEWIFFQDSGGYLVMRAQVMSYSSKWIERTFLPVFCGYLGGHRRSGSSAGMGSRGSSSRTSASTW